MTLRQADISKPQRTDAIGQRMAMRALFKMELGNERACVDRFTKNLLNGKIKWERRNNYSASQYAQIVWDDGIRKGWLK